MKTRLLVLSTVLGTTFAIAAISSHAKDMMNMAMGPMNMTGVVTMNGKNYDMECSMKPIGKPKTMMMDMGGPMNMTGTMTMMGQKYNCSMKMTPKK